MNKLFFIIYLLKIKFVELFIKKNFIYIYILVVILNIIFIINYFAII